MESAHNFERDQLEKAGMKQKRNDIRSKGRHFQAGELVWVYRPRRKKGRCPKLDCHWEGPCVPGPAARKEKEGYAPQRQVGRVQRGLPPFPNLGVPGARPEGRRRNRCTRLHILFL